MSTVIGARNTGIVVVAVAALVWAGVSARNSAPDSSGIASVAATSERPAPPDPLARLLAEKTAKPAWQPAPPAPGEKIYPGFGIRTRPPGDDDHPRVDEQKALATARYVGAVAGASRATADVELRDVLTNDFAGDEARDAGLAWVATFENTEGQCFGCGLPGHAGATPSPPAPSTLTGCTTIVIIDAGTGRPIDGVMQTC